MVPVHQTKSNRFRANQRFHPHLFTASHGVLLLIATVIHLFTAENKNTCKIQLKRLKKKTFCHNWFGLYKSKQN